MPWLPLILGLDPSWDDLGEGFAVFFLLSYGSLAIAILLGSTVNRRAFRTKYLRRSEMREFALALPMSILIGAFVVLVIVASAVARVYADSEDLEGGT